MSEIISKQNASEYIDKDYVQQVFGREIIFDIETDENFMNTLGVHLVREFGEIGPILNQGRMINRISAAEKILELNEARNKVRMTHVMLMRPDIFNINGSAYDIIMSMINNNNWALVDEDVYAHLIDGIGDRYIRTVGCAVFI